jgi:hypothetical protein
MMLSPLTKVLLLTACVPMVTACNSIFGTKQTRVNVRPAGETLRADGYAEAQIALGRDALDKRQYGLAIIAFRNARQFPEQSAAALNGLAIAYLGLGRRDLAERYFRNAVALAPENARYRSNLARYEAKYPIELSPPAPTPRPSGDLEQRLAARAKSGVTAVAGLDPNSAVRIERPATSLWRVSRNHVILATEGRTRALLARQTPGRSIAAGNVAVPEAHQPHAKGVTVSSPRSRTAKEPVYPVRIRISSPDARIGDGNDTTTISATQAEARQAGYPVKISLGPVR